MSSLLTMMKLFYCYTLLQTLTLIIFPQYCPHVRSYLTFGFWHMRNMTHPEKPHVLESITTGSGNASTPLSFTLLVEIKYRTGP